MIAVGEFAVVAVEVGKVLDEKAAFLAEGKLVALKLFAVPPHTAAELAGVAGVVRNLDIVVLAVERLAEALAYAAADRVDVVAY